MTEPYVEDDINLRDYWRVLVRRRFLVLMVTAVVSIASVIYALRQPNIYLSKATLIPLGESPGGVRGALGELSGLLPLKLGLTSSSSPVERILAVLRSRSMAEDVIQRLNLMPRLYAEKWDSDKQAWLTDDPPTLQRAALSLRSLVDITTDPKTGVITIAVEYTDRELTAVMANQYIDSLHRILNDKAFSVAKKNRLFVEGRLRKTRRNLDTAEEALQQFERINNIVALDAQAEAAVQAVATLQGEIMAKEVQLGVLQRAVTGASREVTLRQEELRGLRAQLDRMQHGAEAEISAGGLVSAFPVLDKAPELKLQYVRIRREAVIQNTLFTLLTQQLEQAKIDESRDETAFQVLDLAIPPEWRVKPNRRLIVLLATVAGVFLSVFVAFARDYLDSAIRTREQVEQQLKMPVLATVPLGLPSTRRRWQRRMDTSEAILVLRQSSGSLLVEAYRYLWARLKQCDGGRGARTILMTSTAPNQGAMTVVANLAVVAANLGNQTLLVDCNIGQPALHRLLDCPLVPGLPDMLSNPDEWQKGVQATAVDNLYLIPAGTASASTFTSFESLAFDTLIARFRESYDLILFAVSPGRSFTDVAVLGSKADMSCLVLTSGVSRVESARETKTVLESVDAHVVGAILLTCDN